MTTKTRLLVAAGSVWLALLLGVLAIPYLLVRMSPVPADVVYRGVVWTGLAVLVGGAMIGLAVLFAVGLASRIATAAITAALSACAWAATLAAAWIILGNTFAYAIGPLGEVELALIMLACAVEAALIARSVGSWKRVTALGASESSGTRIGPAP